jgi:3',5'-cyclic AMP phosphodiesterase CpdA
MGRTIPALRSTSRPLGRRKLGRGLLLAGILAAALPLVTMSRWTGRAPAGDARRSPVVTSHPALPVAAPPSAAVRPAARRLVAPPLIAAAGDIACDPASRSFHGGTASANACHMGATARLLGTPHPVVVLTLGDNQYENGTLAKFRRSYDRSWGRLKGRTRPAPGNHDYRTPRAAGYFDYFGPAAGRRSRGYYSFDVGGWHLIALNSECAPIGGCTTGSRQERWLRADLAAHPARCTLAYWHKPRFSSGMHGNNATYVAFWQALYRAGADVVLVGHDHDYERFAPQTPHGKADPASGIRQFVVGTGGKTHDGFRTIRANSQVRNSGTFGVLRLTLHPSSYDWRFVPEPGKTFTDRGHGSCH